MRRYQLLLLAALGAGLVAGCGPPSGIGPTLARARVSCANVAGAVAVARADSQLTEAERQWTELGNPAAAEHHAYLSLRSSESAEQQALILAQRLRDLEARETERGIVLTLSDVLRGGQGEADGRR